jgi:hypothetical protein
MTDSDGTPGGLQPSSAAGDPGPAGKVAVITGGPRGFGATAMAANAAAVLARDEEALRSFPIGRLSRPGDVTAAVFLASGPPSGIAGAALGIVAGEIML